MAKEFKDKFDVALWFLFRTVEERKWIKDYIAMNPQRFQEENEGVRCRRCNHVLTDPASSAAGIGPVCLQKEKAEAGEVCEPPRKEKGLSKVVAGLRQLLLFPVDVKP